jgi:hypothetical protein
MKSWLRYRAERLALWVLVRSGKYITSDTRRVRSEAYRKGNVVRS